MVKRFLDSLFGRNDLLPAAESPAEGEIYAFRTTPCSDFAPPDTGRHAAFKVLCVTEKVVGIAVLDGIWPAPPSLDQAGRAEILAEHRFAHRGDLAVFALVRTAWRPEGALDALVLLGRRRLSAAERAQANAIHTNAGRVGFSVLGTADVIAESEWRWANDRDALLAESDAQDAAEEASRAAREERYNTRLKTLTFDQLLSETPFENWTPSPPFPPEDFTRAARTTLHDACRALGALGPKPRKAEARAILKRTVEWFNAADEEAGGVIETEEREDICMALEEIAFAARQPALAGEIDRWREW
jgi:hypothetical protein